jgi:hypothetical protein
VNHALLAELFRSAGDYHGVLAAYAAALRSGADIEAATQAIVGASLRYRAAIDRLLDDNDPVALRVVASRSRLLRLRKTLANACRQYNTIKRSSRQATASSRSMSARTVP